MVVTSVGGLGGRGDRLPNAVVVGLDAVPIAEPRGAHQLIGRQKAHDVWCGPSDARRLHADTSCNGLTGEGDDLQQRACFMFELRHPLEDDVV